jgi:hypothetical protein
VDDAILIIIGTLGEAAVSHIHAVYEQATERLWKIGSFRCRNWSGNPSRPKSNHPFPLRNLRLVPRMDNVCAATS